MHARPIRFAIAILFAAVAWGQTIAGQSASQVFNFTYAQSPSDMQQITNVVRTVGEITQAYLDPGAKTLAVNGTPAQLAMASWIFGLMDQPSPANRATQEYRPSGSANDVLEVMYLTHPGTPQSFQEIVNAVRTIPEMTKVFPVVGPSALVIRGTDNQIAMAMWLFHQLDLPAGLQPAQNPAAHQYVTPGVTNDEAQVLLLSHPWTMQNMQEIVNAVRTIPQLTKVFPSIATGAVSVRGAPATLALAAWLFRQLDQAPPALAALPQEFQMPGGADDVTQVFYLAPGTQTASLQTVLSAVRAAISKPVFSNTALRALILRGKATQIATADLLIKQMTQP